jgi:putative spermidine/putrescine transport system substrate-binding protein
VCLLALAAAGCGGSSSAVSSNELPTGETLPSGGNGVPMRTRVGATEHQLNLIAWRGFTPAGIIAPFRAATGCAVNVTYASSPGELLSLVRSGGYDGAVAPGDVSGRLIARHDVAPVDTSLIPDFGNLTPKLQSPPATTVDGVHYGIAYMWGSNPLVYNTIAVHPPPTSWSVMFNGTSYAGAVTAPDSPMYIADAALYLESAEPSLGISDPYELTEPQFHAALRVLQRQRAQIGDYWSTGAGAAREFAQGTAVVGQVRSAQYSQLRVAGEPVASVVPSEGVTGSIDSWMMSSNAADPDCMLKWLAYTATPIVQASVSRATQWAPSNPDACVVLDALQPGYCTARHVTDSAYLDRVAFAKTPVRACGDGHDNCVGYARWITAWELIAG